MCVYIEYDELQQLSSANQRREERLARVRGKNFTQKEEEMAVRTGKGRKARR